MKRNRLVVLALVGLLSLSANTQAQTPDFTFKIPIDLQNLRREVDQIAVKVYLFSDNAISFDPFYNGWKYLDPNSQNDAHKASVATKMTVIPVDKATGNLKRTVTLKLKMGNPGIVKKYACIVYLHHKGTNEWVHGCNAGTKWCASEDGSTEHLKRFGSI